MTKIVSGDLDFCYDLTNERMDVMIIERATSRQLGQISINGKHVLDEELYSIFSKAIGNIIATWILEQRTIIKNEYPL